MCPLRSHGESTRIAKVQKNLFKSQQQSSLKRAGEELGEDLPLLRHALLTGPLSPRVLPRTFVAMLLLAPHALGKAQLTRGCSLSETPGTPHARPEAAAAFLFPFPQANALSNTRPTSTRGSFWSGPASEPEENLWFKRQIKHTRLFPFDERLF